MSSQQGTYTECLLIIYEFGKNKTNPFPGNCN